MNLIGQRVLVIEDESLLTMLLQENLADLGCEVIGTASRFNDAMEKAKSLSFDVAILGVNLKGDPTFPIAETLAERGLAFVFATGYGTASFPASLQRRSFRSRISNATWSERFARRSAASLKFDSRRDPELGFSRRPVPLEEASRAMMAGRLMPDAPPPLIRLAARGEPRAAAKLRAQARALGSSSGGQPSSSAAMTGPSEIGPTRTAA
jgi:CheY-like chemotaxis protein